MQTPTDSPDERSPSSSALDDRRQRGLDRMNTFADAVIAIAATLLVLPLVSTAADIGGQSVPHLLSADRDGLLAFVLSFVVICRFWISHHAMYEHIVGCNRPLMWFTCLFLLSIVFLPFPTELIGAGSAHDRATLALYIGTLLLATAAMLGQQVVIARSPTLQPPDLRGTFHVSVAVIGTVAMALAFILAVAVPSVGVWWLLILILSGVVEKRVASRRSPAGGGAT